MSCLELWAVVNNAGIATVGNMEWMSLQSIKRVLDVNTFGPFAVTNAFLPLLRKPRGRVVIVSSLAGKYVQRDITAYWKHNHNHLVMLRVIHAGIC
jgi:NAD(P)-dependent dehydrogenase (short-subunit alcohol dehydrogenase family)